MTELKSFSVGFTEQYITINAKGTEAENLVDFLCCDLQVGTGVSPRAIYDLIIEGNHAALSQKHEDKLLYAGDCRYELAYALINEILYHCVVDNRAGYAVHAAAVGSGGGGILLPGQSGAGKSTLCAWLVACGCKYLTDELVVLSGSKSRLTPFTRPFSFKAGSLAVLSSFLAVDPELAITGARGFMLPHRLVNERFIPDAPPLSLVLFPEYKADAKIELKKLSAAEGCARLLQCYVNARNFEGHGIRQMAELTRSVPVYQLTYGGYDGLHELLCATFPSLFTQ